MREIASNYLDTRWDVVATSFPRMKWSAKSLRGHVSIPLKSPDVARWEGLKCLPTPSSTKEEHFPHGLVLAVHCAAALSWPN